MSISSLVLLAGGLATRLQPVTKTIPKALIDINGVPFIDHQLKLLKQNGIQKVVLCIGYLGEQIEEFTGNGSRYGLELVFSHDGPKLLGTGGAIRKACSFLDDVFFVLYGDSYLDIDYKAVGNFFLQNQRKGLMTVMKNDNQWDTSNVVYKDNVIKVYDKKNKTPDMNYIDYGLGVLKRTVIEGYPEDTVIDLADIYQQLVREQELLGYVINRRFYEIGSFKGIEETKEYLLHKKENL